MKKRRVALVLAGGGPRGVAHIGAIEELERQGFEISAVAGTSMGALVGGVYASGYLEPFKEWMRALDKYKVFSLVDFALSTEGLVKGDRVMRAMKELVPDVKIEQIPLPFAAVAAFGGCLYLWNRTISIQDKQLDAFLLGYFSKEQVKQYIQVTEKMNAEGGSEKSRVFTEHYRDDRLKALDTNKH